MGKKHRKNPHQPPANVEGPAVSAPAMSAAKPAPIWQRVLPFLAILLLTAAAFAPARHAGFIWDDNEYLLGNTNVQQWNTFFRLWVPGTKDNTALYVPMVTSCLWLEHKIWGLGQVDADGTWRCAGYYYDAMVLHACSAMLLFTILRRLKLPGGGGVAWLSAAIWAVHPTSVESVAWLAERKNNLCAVFFFASFYFSCPALGIFDGTAKKRDYPLAMVFFVAAMLSKVAACFLPAALFLLIWWRRNRVTRPELLRLVPMGVIVVGIGSVVAHFEHQRGGTLGPAWDFSIAQRILIAGNAFWFQLGKLLWPYPVMAIYPRFDIEAGKPSTNGFLLIAPVAFAVVVAALFRLRHRIGRGPLVVLLIYTAGLFPTLGFVNFFTMLYSFVADHYQYLAAPAAIAGILELAALGWRTIIGRRADIPRLVRLAPAVLGGAVVASLAVMSYGVCHLYRSGTVLWEHAYQFNPNNVEVLENLAFAKLQAVPLDFPAVIALSDRSIRLWPDDWRHYAARSYIYKRVGMEQQMAFWRHEAEKRMPPEQLSRRDEILRQNALGALPPLSPDLRKGRDLENEGKWDDAIAWYEAMLRKNPDDQEASLRLGFAWMAAKREGPKAVAIFQGIVSRYPENADAWLFLGFALRGAGNDAEGSAALEKARQLGGDAVLGRHPELLEPVK